MITSECVSTECVNDAVRTFTGPLALTIDNSTINDAYEHYNYVDNANAAGHIDTFDLGTAITLDQESDIIVHNNSHVAGIALAQGYDWADDAGTGGTTFDNNLVVNDSVTTSGS